VAKAIAKSSSQGYCFVQADLLWVVEPYLEISMARAVDRTRQRRNGYRNDQVHPAIARQGDRPDNLPIGVKLLKDVDISKELTFALRATSDVLLGQTTSITYHATVNEGDQSIVQSSGIATTRIDQERK